MRYSNEIEVLPISTLKIEAQDHYTSHLAECVASALRFKNIQVGGDTGRVGISVGASGDDKELGYTL